jgi:hypothetical protein
VHPTGGSLRVFRQFAWLEVGSSKMALSCPTHQRVTPAVGRTKEDLDMLSKFFNRNKNTHATSADRETLLTPGKVFRWPQGGTITAIDMVIIALPKALFPDGDKIGEVVDADDEMNIAIPPDSDKVFLYVQPGMSVTIKRHAESYVVAQDNVPRRIRITEPKNQ